MNLATVVSKNHKIILTFAELISRYEISNRADGKSEKTISGYNHILLSFLRHLQKDNVSPSLSCFTIDTTRDYILHLRNRFRFDGHPFTPTQADYLSPRTVQCHVRALKALSSWLYAEGYTSENRLENLKLPKAPSKVIEPLTPDETKKIITSINKNSPTGTRNHAVLVTLLDNGLRASEIAGIELSHVDFKAGSIKVMGKGGKERIVPIGRYAQSLLLDYATRVRPTPANAGCDRLFLSPDGHPITANTIKLVFSRLARRSGVNRLHAHLCRHTFAINYLLNGGDIFSLKAILGHASLDMVSRYLHFTSSQLTVQHHRFSPMDKLHLEGKAASGT